MQLFMLKIFTILWFIVDIYLWVRYNMVTKLEEFGGIKEGTFDKRLFDKNLLWAFILI